jgi:Lrp/AsnC family transcriptional regulator for asnA, asnC and gidA
MRVAVVSMPKDKLDDLDFKIVRLLLQDSTAPASTIASYLGLHPSTVSYRVRKLRESGVIKKFTVSVDWRRLGKEVEAALLINCSPKHFEKVASALTAMDEVIELHTLTGFADILAMVTVTNMAEYKGFIEKRLGAIPEIDSFRAGIVLEDFKEE